MDSLKEIIESILFVAGESVDFEDIASKLDITVSEVKAAVSKLKKEKEDSFSGIQIQIFNNKAQLCSNPNYAEKVAEVLNPIKEKALTKAVLEVAAIIAYKQPITRLEIEHIRSVNSDYAVNVLIENSMIEVIGRKDAIGKPLLYGTTDVFLKRFNLEDIDQLPDYDELISRIKIIKTPDNSLFDYSNIGPSEVEEVNVLETHSTNELDELEALEKEIDKETIHTFFHAIKQNNAQQVPEEELKDEQQLEASEAQENNGTHNQEPNSISNGEELMPHDEIVEEIQTLQNEKENDVDYQNLISVLGNTEELISDISSSDLI